MINRLKSPELSSKPNHLLSQTFTLIRGYQPDQVRKECGHVVHQIELVRKWNQEIDLLLEHFRPLVPKFIRSMIKYIQRKPFWTFYRNCTCLGICFRVKLNSNWTYPLNSQWPKIVFLKIIVRTNRHYYKQFYQTAVKLNCSQNCKITIILSKVTRSNFWCELQTWTNFKFW